MIRNVRGRIQATTRPVRVGRAVIIGRKARILATVKTGNQQWRDKFDGLRRRLGLDVREVQSWEWVTVYDVTGAPEALSEFADSECVNSWEYAVDVRGR